MSQPTKGADETEHPPTSDEAIVDAFLAVPPKELLGKTLLTTKARQRNAQVFILSRLLDTPLYITS